MSDGIDPNVPASEADPAVPPGLLQRLLPPVDQEGEDGQPKPSRMAPREQLVAAGLGFANVAIVAGTASSVREQQALVLLAGLLASVITVVGARVGNRLLGMVGLFAATLVRPSSAAAATFLAVVLPYYAAAMWMFLRYNRMMKAQNIARRQRRIEARGGGGSTRAKGTGKPGRSGSGQPPARALPTASKRYTPPKPAKKRPPPSARPPKDRSPVD